MKRSPLLVPAVIVGAYLLLSDGPVFWLALSSIKSRQDLFTLPPKLFFHPVSTGYEAVFGIGAASTTAIAVGLYSSLLT
jgi:multiple sugar transport system permease protein